MFDRRCARDQQDVRRLLKKPGKRDLHRRGPKGRCCCVERRRLQRSEASQWKEWHVAYALFREVIDKAIIGSMCDVVKVLHADYLRNSPGLCELLPADVAQTQM